MDLSGNKELIAEIEVVFADTPHPGKADSDLVTHFCPECLEVGERFRNIRWQNWKDNPLDLIRYSDLSFLSPAAFRYVIPLFMLATLTAYEKADVLPGSIISSFHQATSEEKKQNLQAQLKSAEEASKTKPHAFGEGNLEALLKLLSDALKNADTDAGKQMNEKIRALVQARINSFTLPELRTVLKFLTLLQQTHGEDWSTYPLKPAIADLQSVIQRWQPE